MVSSFIFLRDARCCKQKEESFSLLLLFKQEFDWMSIKPIEVTDRLLGGVGGGG